MPKNNKDNKYVSLFQRIVTPPSIHSPVVYHVIWPGAARRTFTKTCSPAQVDPGRMLFSYPFIEGLMHWYTNVLLRFIQVQIPSRSLNMIIIIIIITIIYIMITTMIMTKRCRKLALLFVTTIVQRPMPHLHQILLIIHVLRTFFLKFTHFFRIFSKTEKQNPHQLLRADNKNIIRYSSKWWMADTICWITI